ncbi:TadE/TadG family type IV pilus assembly protein [Aestuariispira ectoiniformans]|uniref:TadE/TadG family type IV pilus assembly protein n=1 Tax=Aestuariispira ectoiniformans TaxID=2775080 RepID=UPI00223AB5F5|nr:TadE/TadG family type IV pilus assembly protein [Aestuariispira ectoiniformans]
MKRLAQDDSGATLAEFALVAPVLAYLILGSFEFGAIMLTNTLMEGGLREASRYGITGREESGEDRLTTIRNIIDEHTLGLVNMDDAKIDVRVYDKFGSIGDGEPYIDGNGDGDYTPGESFSDQNGNGVWDADVGQQGAGEDDDVVLYSIEYDWPIMTPAIGKIIGKDGKFPLKASIAVRNEPWE